MCGSIFIAFQGEGVQSQLLGVAGEDRPLVPCVSSLCSWKQDVREGMLAASDGQEARRGQPKPGGAADCQGLAESSGGWRTRLGKKQGLG